MKSKTLYMILLGMLTGLLILSCGDSDPAGPGGGGGNNDDPNLLPEIPEPSNRHEIPPPKSDEIDIGLSAPMEEFIPYVTLLERMIDDGSTTWTIENRELPMICGGVRAIYSCDENVQDKGYVSEAPRLLHRRYWRRVVHEILDPGAQYSREEEIEYGSSTTDTRSQSFSRTIGVEVSASAGWGPFSATVTASYEETRTSEQIHSVTFEETNRFKETYTSPTDQNKVIVYGLWQLVDVFMLVDAKRVPIDASDTLVHLEIEPLARVEFLNRDVVAQKVTRFDP
jgi:hypothetical protein